VSTRPTITLRVETPGARESATSLGQVASAQRDVAAAQEETARASESASSSAQGLSTTLGKVKGLAESAQGAIVKVNTVVQALGALSSPSADSVAALGSALSALPGPLGIVGGAVAAATTGFKLLRDAIKGVPDVVVPTTGQLGFMGLALKQINDELARGAKIAKATQAVLAGGLPTDTLTTPKQAIEAEAIAEKGLALQERRAAIIRELLPLERARAKAVGPEDYFMGQRELDMLRNQLESVDFELELLRVKSTEVAKGAKSRIADFGLEAAPAAPKAMAASTKQATQSVADFAAELGNSLNPELSKLLGLTQDVGGALIRDIDIYGPASDAMRTHFEGTVVSMRDIARIVDEDIASFIRNTDLHAREAEEVAERMIKARAVAMELTNAVVASGESYGAAALSAALYGDSIAQAINATARAAFVEGTVGALGALAKAAIFSVINPPAVAPMLQAAAMFSGQAAIAAGFAAATGGLTGGGASQARAPDLAAPEDFGQRAQEVDRSQEVFLNFSGGGGRPLARADATAIVGALVAIARDGGMRLEGARA
jgi:hypothetical protein